MPLAGIDLAIHVFPGNGFAKVKTWMAGTSPGKGHL
jgi:hypothetical protein